MLVRLEKAGIVGSEPDVLDRGLHRVQVIDHPVAEFLRPVDVLGHQPDLARVVEQGDDRLVPVGIGGEALVLLTLGEKTIGLHHLQRQRRRLENKGEDRIRVECHRCDEGADIVGLG